MRMTLAPASCLLAAALLLLLQAAAVLGQGAPDAGSLKDAQALTSSLLPSSQDGLFLESRIPGELRSTLFGEKRLGRPLSGGKRWDGSSSGSGSSGSSGGSGGSSSAASPPKEGGLSKWLQQSAAGLATKGPIYQSECTGLKPALVRKLISALRASLDFTIQEGAVDFGLLGQEGEVGSCSSDSDGCAFSNPSSPYGLTMLPLAPEEDPAQKGNADTTPKTVQKELKDSSAAASTSAVLKSRLSALSGGAAAATANVAGTGPVFQLRPDEVVLLAGCLPPGNTSRYFAFTPYTYAAYNKDTSSWVSVFGSMGDSLSVIRQPATCKPPAACSEFDSGLYGLRNRLNASLPSDLGAIERASTPNVTASSGSAQAPPPSSSWWIPSWWASSLLAAGPGGGKSTAQQEQEQQEQEWQQEQQQELRNLPSAYERFTVVIMTASEEAAAQVQAALTSTLRWQNIVAAVNVLPIPAEPFGAALGLDPLSAYYMLLMRNIIPAGRLDPFLSYLQAEPWSAWRMTPRRRPKAASPPAMFPSLLLLGAGATGDASGSFSGPLINSSRYGPYHGFPPAEVVPRVHKWLNQSEEWLRPAFTFLQDRIQTRYGGFAQAWNLISESPLGALGIDYGADCLERKLEACNGDNRDAQYLSAFPLVQLDRVSKVLWILGVNHARTGTATYTNVALMDPLQKQGLQAFDDSELAGSADDLLAGGPFQAHAPFLFAVRFSRNCTGRRFCKTVPQEGPRSLPLNRPALVMLRAYVNPATGVGPPTSSLVRFRTVTITPKPDARPWDSFARDDTTNAQVTASTCSEYLYRTTLCTSGPTAECCNAVGAWNREGCWCEERGKALLAALPLGVGTAALVGVARMCSQRTAITSC